MKHLLLAFALVLTSTAAHAGPYWFHNKVTKDEMASALDNQNDLLSAGIAGSNALGMLPELDGAIAVGLGHYSGENAMSVGYTKDLREDIRVKGGMTYDSQNNAGFGVGAAFKF
jgi:autotransporter adhesin